MLKTFIGRVISGKGQGERFVDLPWVKEECKRLLGFTPYPGTLNLLISHEEKAFLLRLAKEQGVILKPPEGSPYCKALLLRASVEGFSGALVFPEDIVWEYRDKDVVEFVAPVKLRKELGLSDNCMCRLEIVDAT